MRPNPLSSTIAVLLFALLGAAPLRAQQPANPLDAVPEKMPADIPYGTPIERATEDYLTCLDGVYPHADYVTVNISSPNTQNLRSLQMNLGPEEWLTVAARASEGPMSPAGLSDLITIVMRIKGSDLSG